MGWDDMTIRLRLRGVRAVKVLEDTFWGVGNRTPRRRTESSSKDGTPAAATITASHPSRRASVGGA